MTFLDIPDDLILNKTDDKTEYGFGLTVFAKGDKLRFQIGDESTSWIGFGDGFLKRIRFGMLNRCFLAKHLQKEIEIKNILDSGRGFLERESYLKAIECFDEVIYYDKNYGEALLLKSRALFGQRHFVKALRYYKKAIRADANLKDIDYHKLLLKKSSKERDGFPKIKLQIFTGDEYFSRRNYQMAIENYNRALENPSAFKSKILYKLLNKKATALFHLSRFDEALECFKRSLDLRSNAYAQYMCGFCEHSLGLPLDEGFKRPLDITKSQKLCQALILNESKFHADAIICIDDLLEGHFACDKIHFIALSCKISAMESLGMDVQREIDLLERL